MTLADFLHARVAEDQERAEHDIEHFGDPSDNRDKWIVMLSTRVLAECEAKRAIIALDSWLCDGSPNGLGVHGEAVRLLAAVYVDHPDYDPEWRISA